MVFKAVVNRNRKHDYLSRLNTYTVSTTMRTHAVVTGLKMKYLHGQFEC